MNIHTKPSLSSSKAAQIAERCRDGNSPIRAVKVWDANVAVNLLGCKRLTRRLISDKEAVLEFHCVTPAGSIRKGQNHNMLRKGVDIARIAEYTGLTVEQIRSQKLDREP